MNRLAHSIAILGVALSSACQAIDGNVTPARTWTTMSGQVATLDLDLAAVGVMPESSFDDLGAGGRESNNALILEWGAKGDRWELFGHSTDSKGTLELGDDLVLDGVVLDFDDGTVDTDLHLGLYGLRWVRPLMQRGSLEVGAGASLVVVEFDLDLDQDATGKSIGRDGVTVFPLPALDLNYHGELFDTRLSLAGMWVWADGGSGDLLDLDFRVRVPIFDDVGELVCGYHELELELERSGGGVRQHMVFAGPYLGVRFGF